MNQDLNKLHAYPFEKLALLKEHTHPPQNLPHIELSLGEPQHAAPDFVREVMKEHLGGLSRYPLTRGEHSLRQAISAWLMNRFNLPQNSLHPVSGLTPQGVWKIQGG